MAACQHRGMDMSLPFLSVSRTAAGSVPWRRLARHAEVAAMVLLVALVLGAAWLARPRVEGQGTNEHTFAHWRSEGRDWLLVAVPDEGALVVYDATDGRPLRRLPVAGIRDIVLEGDWVFVTGTTGPGLRLLRLPQLTWRHMPGATADR